MHILTTPSVVAYQVPSSLYTQYLVYVFLHM